MTLIGLGLALIAGFGPMMIYAALITVFDRYEKEPLWLMLAAFAWGAIVAAGLALVFNTVFGVGVAVLTHDERLTEITTAVISAPLVEETVKGLAVLIIFLLFRREFNSLLDGVIYGALVGFGFAATENVLYIYNGFASGGLPGLVMLTFFRAVGIAFLHASLTALTGTGLAALRVSSSDLRFLAAPGGYALAITGHFLHNLMASAENSLLCLFQLGVNWAGYFALFLFMVWLVVREGRVMRRELEEEMRSGLITAQEYQTACSVSGQLSARIASFGRPDTQGKLYNLLGQLAFSKDLLNRRGAAREPDAAQHVDALRAQIMGLRGQPL